MGTYAVYDRSAFKFPTHPDNNTIHPTATRFSGCSPSRCTTPSPTTSSPALAKPFRFRHIQSKTSAAPVKHPGSHVFLHATRPHKFSSISKLTFCAVGHAHDRSAEDQEPQGPSLQAHSRVHNSCPRVIELLPPSDHHDQNIFCCSSRCSTTTSTSVQKASTPSLSSRSAVSSANQVGRLAT